MRPSTGSSAPEREDRPVVGPRDRAAAGTPVADGSTRAAPPRCFARSGWRSCTLHDRRGGRRMPWGRMRCHLPTTWRLLVLSSASVGVLLASSFGGTGARAGSHHTITFSACTRVSLEVLHSEALYVSHFWRFSPTRSLGISTQDVGSRVDLGEVTAGELVLGIKVVETGKTYKTGPGSRNPDGKIHAVVTGSRVAFEDWRRF